jgi:hypothetical protein
MVDESIKWNSRRSARTLAVDRDIESMAAEAIPEKPPDDNRLRRWRTGLSAKSESNEIIVPVEEALNRLASELNIAGELLR